MECNTFVTNRICDIHWWAASGSTTWSPYVYQYERTYCTCLQHKPSIGVLLLSKHLDSLYPALSRRGLVVPVS